MDCNYDVTIVGGGVVGCAVCFQLAQAGYTCLLIEKSNFLLSGASSGNSGMLHTGYDAKEPIEIDCIKRSQARVFDILQKLNVPVKMTGATMVAWNESQLQRIPEVLSYARNIGIKDIYQLSPSQLYRKEPNLSRRALGGLVIDSESVTDPWLFPMLLVNDAIQKGAQIQTNCRLESCDKSGNQWTMVTSRGIATSKCVVNCAGLYGDIVDKLCNKELFKILPRKGQYSIYNKSASCLINSSIVPVPTDIGKGVIVFKSVYGNVVVGPTAEHVDSRLMAPIDDVISRRLSTVAKETVPPLADYEIVRKYTGVRPATQFKDYIIKCDPEKNWITVGGIRSTGLSACLGIAERVQDLIQGEVRVEPSRGSCYTISEPVVQYTNHGTAFIDCQEYVITHPLTRCGKMDQKSKM